MVPVEVTNKFIEELGVNPNTVGKVYASDSVHNHIKFHLECAYGRLETYHMSVDDLKQMNDDDIISEEQFIEIIKGINGTKFSSMFT